MNTITKALLLLVVVVALLATAVSVLLINRGFSARDEPTRIEAYVARQVRHLAVPRGARELRSPVAFGPEILEEARAHFADHCASCHANDGSGQTEIGENLYPKAPDMRLPATQSLSDGELFYIIENGIRFTGMPAWGAGKSEHADESWKLVLFIRHLPALTPEELEEMKTLNPKSRDEWREEEEIRRFLEGEDKAPSPPSHTHPGGDHG